MKRYIVTEGQTLSDIAIEQYGDVMSVFDLITDNLDLTGLDSELEAGQVLLIRDTPVNPAVIRHFRNRSIRVNTGEYVQTQEVDSDWLLANGTWNDQGFWRDDEFWTDNP